MLVCLAHSLDIFRARAHTGVYLWSAPEPNLWSPLLSMVGACAADRADSIGTLFVRGGVCLFLGPCPRQ